MSNYFDNQEKYSWNVSTDGALVITDHGDHTHTLDITDISIGELVNNTGQVMGEAHRAASHDYKTISSEAKNNEGLKMSGRNDFLESLKVDQETQDKLQKVIENYNSNEKKTTEKRDEGGRERGDDGPGKPGREADLKSGNRVSAMRADMKADFNEKQSQGEKVVQGKVTQGETIGNVMNNGYSTNGNSESNGGHGNAGGINGGIGSGKGGQESGTVTGGGHGSTGGASVSGGGHGNAGGVGGSHGGIGAGTGGHSGH